MARSDYRRWSGTYRRLPQQVQDGQDDDQQSECASDEPHTASPTALPQRSFATVSDAGGMTTDTGRAFDASLDRQGAVLRQAKVRRSGSVTLVIHGPSIDARPACGKEGWRSIG